MLITEGLRKSEWSRSRWAIALFGESINRHLAVPRFAVGTLLIAFQILCLASMHAAAQDEETLKKIESRLAAERRRIENGEFIIDNVVTTTMARGDDVRRSQYHLWLSPEKFRVDELVGAWVTRSGRNIPQHTSVRCRGCYSDSTVFQHSDEPAADGASGPMLAQITDLALVPANMPLLPNPLVLGLAPVQWLQTERRQIDSYIGLRDKSNVRIVETKENGARQINITYQKSFGKGISDVRLLVAPDQGDSVVRIEEIIKSQDQVFSFSVDNEPQFHTESGIWYPKKVVFERRDDGKTVAVRDKCEIKIVSLNTPIAPEVFSLNGIATLKPGTPVFRKSKMADPNFKDGKAKWDGRQLDPSQP